MKQSGKDPSSGLMLSSSANQNFQNIKFAPTSQEPMSPKENAIDMVDTPDGRQNMNSDYYGNYAKSPKNS